MEYIFLKRRQPWPLKLVFLFDLKTQVYWKNLNKMRCNFIGIVIGMKCVSLGYQVTSNLVTF